MKHILKALTYVLFYFLLQVVLSMIFSAVAVSRGINSEEEVAAFVNNNILLITLIANVLTLLFITLFRRVRNKTATGIFRFKGITPKKTLLSIIVSFSVASLFYIITLNVQFDNAVLLERSSTYFSQNIPWLGTFMRLTATLFLAPVTEEYLCRGVMFQELNGRFSKNITIVICSAVFGIMHMMAGGIVLTAGAFIMGLVFGIIYVKTGSLAVAMIAHIAANLPDYIFPFFSGKITNSVSVAIVCILVFIAVPSAFFLCNTRESIKINSKK